MDDKDILVGRKNELKQLESIMNSNEAEFVVVYGRRRVGKTFLINTFFDDNYAFKLTGLAKKSKSEQLSNFAEALNRYGDGRKFTKPRTWFEAFNSLRALLEAKIEKGKQVVFIDELPWMDTRGSNLITAIEHFWNDWASTRNNLVFITCGSATSWITKKLLKNRGGLHNRVTQKLFIRPFILAETKEYLQSRNILMDDKDITESYMIMGGIPFYLKHIRRGASLAQNIDEMFFLEHGRLEGEFEALYASLFDNSENYIKVVAALSAKKRGLTRDEILNTTKLENNGHFSTVLKNLISCDFIRFYKPFGNKSKQGLYQLIDPFTLFYYKFIKQNNNLSKPFWQYQQGTSLHNTWLGLAFEQLCLHHHPQIEKALGISGISTQVFSWTGLSRDKEKAQIDLIIKRADRVVNICEMKFYDGEYVMKKKDYDEMVRRVHLFKEANNIKGAVHPVLVTSYGLKPNQYSGYFQNCVTLRDLFE